EAGRRFVASALRSRPEPLHFVHTMRACLRGARRRARLGSDFARHSFPDCRRSQPELGRRERMHELRQVRASVPDRSAGGKGLGRRRDGQEKRQYQRAGPPERSAGMKKVKLATVWLDGCSGCHMSLLDMDAAIISLAQKIELVYGPL